MFVDMTEGKKKGKMSMKQMIRLGILVLMMLVSVCALAEKAEQEQIKEVLLQSGVSQPVQLSVWGDTAACFAETEGNRRLMVLEKREGEWQTVIDNPAALFQDADWPQLLLDSDNAIYWTYTLQDQETVRYHSTRDDGVWGVVDQEVFDSSYGEKTYIWNTRWNEENGGEIVRSFSMADENDNMIGGEMNQYIPASWMTECIRLSDFDVSRFPTMIIETNDYFASENERFFRDAAASLMPGYTFLKGMLKNDALHFLMQKPDGTKVYVICEYESHRAVNLIESTPLPADTYLGVENFTDSLWIDGLCVTVQLLYSGKAGLEYIYSDSAYAEASGGFLFFGDRTVWDASEVPARTLLYGDHPWDDITEIDWTRLPRALDAAAAWMDSSRYAMVVNPNPADRLHMREKADKGSRSQGKYYTGTPVTVMEKKSDWTQVIFGDWNSWCSGWMMKRYLTFGQAGDALYLDVSSMPQMSSKSEQLKVYREPKTGKLIWHMNEGWSTMKVIGIIGEEWYHVWFPASGEYGYVRQSDLTPGNG